MGSIPPEFLRFVNNLESGVQAHVRVSFSTPQELQQCATYFFERAAQQPQLSARFAEVAAKLYFILPTSTTDESTPNLRKALIYIGQKQIERVGASLNGAADFNVEKALGIVKFFGELYNVGFIFKGILKKHLDIFTATKSTCFLSNQCYYCLIDTVKKRVLSVSESDYTVVIRALVTMIEDAEANPSRMERPTEAKKLEAPKPAVVKTFDELFPALNNSSSGVANDTSLPSVWEDKTMIFKRLLEDLTPHNPLEILKKLEDIYKNGVESDTWQIYCDLLIEKALARNELADPIVDICQKLPRCWQSVKQEDFKKYFHSLIGVKLDKVFDSTDTNDQKSQLISILIVIQKFQEHSFSSISHIAGFIEVLIDRAKNSLSSTVLASQILLQLLMITKRKINSKKIQKLPEDVRKNVMKVIASGQSRKVSEKIKSDIKDIAVYIDVEFVEEEDEGVSVTNGNGALDHFLINEPISSGSSGGLSPLASSSSSAVSPFNYFLETQLPFDYSNFIDDLATNNKDTIISSIKTASVHRDWDLALLAEKLFEKSLSENDHATYARLSLLINEGARAYCGKTFEEVLLSVALRALGKELTYDSFVQLDREDVRAMSTAEFISELYKIGWLSNNYLFQCMDKIASTEFETTRRIKIFRALLKPSAIKMMNKRFDDRFIFYTQMIRARVNSITDSKGHFLCLELLELLETISSLSNNSPAVNVAQDTAKESKFDKIFTILSHIKFDDIDDCVGKIIALNIREVEELNLLVDLIIRLAMTSPMQVADYVKLTYKLDGFKMQASNGTTISFKLLLTNRCRIKLLECAQSKIDPAQVSGAYLLVQYISELFKIDMITTDLIYLSMEVFIGNEKECLNAVYCINIMLRSIGPKLEEINSMIMNHYFTLFENFYKSSDENSYRSLVYGKLVALRNNKWVMPSVPVVEEEAEQTLAEEVVEEEEVEPVTVREAKLKSFVIDIDGLSDPEELESIASDLQKHLTTRERVRGFIAVLFRKSFTQHQIIANCAKLLEMMADFVITTEPETTFKDILMEMLSFEFVISNSKRFLDDAAKNSFVSLIVLVGQLYLREILNDDEIHSWLLHKHLSHVALDHLTYLSSIIAPKIQSRGNKQLNTILNMLEANIHDATVDMYKAINCDIDELASAIKYANDFKENNPQTSKAF